MSKLKHVAFSINTSELTASLTTKPNGVVVSNKVVGSPINFRRLQVSQQEVSNSSNTSFQLPSSVANTSTIKPLKKARPSTAGPVLGSSQMLQDIMLRSANITPTSNSSQEISSHHYTHDKISLKKKNEDPATKSSIDATTKNSSTGLDLDRMMAFYDTPVTVEAYHHRLRNQQQLLDPQQDLAKVITTRCSGCGQFAEVCLKCFATFKQQEVAEYKKRLILSVEKLFAKATTRSFTKMSFVIVKWVFTTWKQSFFERQKYRQKICEQFKQQRLRKLFRDWTTFRYERRLIGAMLFAQQQQQVSSCKMKEMLSLQGDFFEQNTLHQVELKILQQTNQTLLTQLEQANQKIEQKNQELTQVKQKLKQAQDTLSLLEKQKIDPFMWDRLQRERLFLRKSTMQLLQQMFTDMDQQLHQLTTEENKSQPNVLFQNIFDQEILSSLDKPEHPSLYSLSHPEKKEGKDKKKKEVDILEMFNAQNRFNAPVDRADLILIQWVNHLLKQQKQNNWISCPQVSNFDDSLQDGKSIVVLTKVLYDHMSKVNSSPQQFLSLVAATSTSSTTTQQQHQKWLNGEPLSEFALEQFQEHMQKETNPQKRVELLASTLGQALWLPQGLVNARDVLVGDTDMNFALLAYLFCACSNNMEDNLWTTICQEMQLQFKNIKTQWTEIQAHQDEPFNSSTSVEFTTRLKLLLVNTFDLKRQLEEERKRMKQSELIWTKSVHIVLRKAFLSLTRLARGQVGIINFELTNSEKKNNSKKELTITQFNQQFACLQSIAFVNELINTKDQQEDASWEIKVIQSYLMTIYCDLARIYKAYGQRNNNSQTTTGQILMNVGDLIELLTECHVLDTTQFTSNDVLTLIRSMDPKKKESINVHHALPPSDFLEALVRVGRKKYTPPQQQPQQQQQQPQQQPQQQQQTTPMTTPMTTPINKKSAVYCITLSESFCLLVDNFILPNAFQAEGDAFRKQMQDPRLCRFFVKNAELLRPLYGLYSIEKPDTQKKKMKKNRPCMTSATCVQLLRDKKVFDEVFTMDKMFQIVSQVSTQKCTTTKPFFHQDESINPMSIRDEEISFDGFQETLVAVACHKFPDPYTSLETRLEKLIHLYLYPTNPTSPTSPTSPTNSTTTLAPTQQSQVQDTLPYNALLL